MKIYSTLFIFLSIIINSQIRFEKGYIISNEGQQKEVLIKNIDWSDNPESFTYKITEDGEQKTGQLVNTKEFGVPNNFKYIKYIGKIDVSSNNINELSNNQNPILEERTVFLNQLVSGKLNLYQYKNKDIEQFFYSQGDGNIIPLIYKKYNPDGDTYKFAENQKYIDQLKELFGGNIPATFKTSKIRYQKSNLVGIFEEYNGKKTETKNNRADFNLNIRPGLSFMNFDLDTESENQVAFKSKTAFRIGLEAELVLPFNKNKWAIVVEPFYYKYKNEENTSNDRYRFNTDFDVLDLQFALRHYMFISTNSKIFINAGFVANLHMTKDAGITYTSLKPGYLNGGARFDKNSSYFNFGVGYNYRNKMSAEIKISTAKEFYDRSLWDASLSQISFILGYNIF